MATPAAADDLPELLDTKQVAAALKQDLYTTQQQLRDGVLPGVKLPGGRWRVRRADVQAMLAPKTPAQRRRELLGDDVVEFVRDLAADAGPLTDEQRDVIRAAFKTQQAQP